MKRTPRLLLAEDDDDLRVTLADSLRSVGFEVVELHDGSEVKAYVDDWVVRDTPKPRVDALLTDLRMPRLDGLELLEYLDKIGADLPTIIITAFADRKIREAARALGAEVLSKPFQLGELERLLRATIDTHEA